MVAGNLLGWTLLCSTFDFAYRQYGWSRASVQYHRTVRGLYR